MMQKPPQQPNRPQIAGDLTPEEKTTLEQMKQRAQQIVLRIGSMEGEKSRLLMMLDQQEQMMQMHLMAIGKRLDIPQGAGWQVVNDKAMIINPAPEPPVVPAEPPAPPALAVVKDEEEEAPAPTPVPEAPIAALAEESPQE